MTPKKQDHALYRKFFFRGVSNITPLQRDTAPREFIVVRPFPRQAQRSLGLQRFDLSEVGGCYEPPTKNSTSGITVSYRTRA